MVAAACSSGRMSYEVGILKSWCKYLLVKMPLYFYGVTDLHTASRMYPLAFSLFQVSYTFPCVYVSQFLGVWSVSLHSCKSPACVCCIAGGLVPRPVRSSVPKALSVLAGVRRYGTWGAAVNEWSPRWIFIKLYEVRCLHLTLLSCSSPFQVTLLPCQIPLELDSWFQSIFSCSQFGAKLVTDKFKNMLNSVSGRVNPYQSPTSSILLVWQSGCSPSSEFPATLQQPFHAYLFDLGKCSFGQCQKPAKHPNLLQQLIVPCLQAFWTCWERKCIFWFERFVLHIFQLDVAYDLFVC